MKHDARFPSSRVVEVEVDASPDPREALAAILAEHPFALDMWEVTDERVLASGRHVFSLLRLTERREEHDSYMAGGSPPGDYTPSDQEIGPADTFGGTE